MTDFIPDIPPQDEDSPEQQARCRALEFAILLRALLDATWREDSGVNVERLTGSRKWRMRLGIVHRRAARRMFLDRHPEARAHVEDIATLAGLPPGAIWRLVERFLVAGEDPAPLVAIQDAIADRPGSKNFDFSVASVN